MSLKNSSLKYLSLRIHQGRPGQSKEKEEESIIVRQVKKTPTAEKPLKKTFFGNHDIFRNVCVCIGGGGRGKREPFPLYVRSTNNEKVLRAKRNRAVSQLIHLNQILSKINPISIDQGSRAIPCVRVLLIQVLRSKNIYSWIPKKKISSPGWGLSTYSRKSSFCSSVMMQSQAGKSYELQVVVHPCRV